MCLHVLEESSAQSAYLAFYHGASGTWRQTPSLLTSLSLMAELRYRNGCKSGAPVQPSLQGPDNYLTLLQASGFCLFVLVEKL